MPGGAFEECAAESGLVPGVGVGGEVVLGVFGGVLRAGVPEGGIGEVAEVPGIVGEFT